MEFFPVVSSTYVNQIAFSLTGAKRKPYAFFVGKTFDFNAIMSASPQTYAAGYLMKYAMELGDDLVTECCKSYKIIFWSNSNNKFVEQFRASDVEDY
jgi:hypothetical protein